MKHRIAAWACLGLFVAAGWGVYFGLANKEIPINPVVLFFADLTCPIGILGMHFAISLFWAVVANIITYALAGVAVEMLRRQLNHSR